MKTIRLFLEPLTAAHASKLFDGLRDERAYRFLADDPPETVEKLAARYALLSGEISPNGQEIWLNWALKRRGQDFYVGYVQATILRAEAAVLIAYHVFPAHWGHGYGREAVQTILAQIAPKYRLGEARAYIDTTNTRSIRLVEALGFELAGTVAQGETLRGHAAEDYLYVLKLGS